MSAKAGSRVVPRIVFDPSRSCRDGFYFFAAALRCYRRRGGGMSCLPFDMLPCRSDEVSCCLSVCRCVTVSLPCLSDTAVLQCCDIAFRTRCIAPCSVPAVPLPLCRRTVPHRRTVVLQYCAAVIRTAVPAALPRVRAFPRLRFPKLCFPKFRNLEILFPNLRPTLCANKLIIPKEKI